MAPTVASDAAGPEFHLTANRDYGTHFSLHEFVEGIKESTTSGTCPRITRLMYTKKSQRGKNMFSDKLSWSEVFHVMPNIRKLMSDFFPKKHKDLPDVCQNMIDASVAAMAHNLKQSKEETEIFISGRVMLASAPPRKRYEIMKEFLITKGQAVFKEKVGSSEFRVEAPPYKTFERDSEERNGTVFPILRVIKDKVTVKLLFGFSFDWNSGLNYDEEYQRQDWGEED